MRALPMLTLLALPLIACDSSDKQKHDLREPLKQFLSTTLRARNFKVNLTDDDPRARPPTKYADAAKGVLYTIRHACLYEDSDVTVSTWIYTTKKERDVARGEPFDLMIKDLRRGDKPLLYRIENFDVGDLHGLLILETLNTGLTNQFTLLTKEIMKGLPSVKE